MMMMMMMMMVMVMMMVMMVMIMMMMTTMTMTTMIAIQWTGRLGRCFGTTYLAGTAVLGASQYSDGVLAVLFLQVVVLRLNATETKTIRYNTSGL